MNYIFQFYYALAAYLNNEFEINLAEYARYFEFRIQNADKNAFQNKNLKL